VSKRRMRLYLVKPKPQNVTTGGEA
jgi:hypothetical protein